MDWTTNTVYRRTYDSRQKVAAGNTLSATDLPLPTIKIGNSPRWEADRIDAFIAGYPGSGIGRPTNRQKRESTDG